MGLPVLILPEAEEALRRNAKWWADNHSAEQAERWYDGFAKAIIALGNHPLRFPLARENDQFPYEVRVMNFGVSSHPTHRALFIPPISNGLKNTTPFSAMPIGPMGKRVMVSASVGSRDKRKVKFWTRIVFGFWLLGKTAVG